MAVMLSSSAFAQVVVDTATTAPLTTSTADNGAAADIEIGITNTTVGSISPAAGDLTALTLDSNNNVTITSSGALLFDAADDTEFNNVTALDIQAGNTGEVAIDGTITIAEDYTQEVTDDGIIDGPYAEGLGRTGILISGTGAFTGNIASAATSTITVEGNTSNSVLLSNGAQLIGNIDLAGAVNMLGDNSQAVNLLGDVTGDVSISGGVTAQGDQAQAVNIAGDVSGAVNISGDIANTGYTYTTRFLETGRDLFDADNTLQAGSAVTVSGTVGNGVFFEQITSDITDATTGETTTVLVSEPSVTQFGSAPAVLIQGANLGLVNNIAIATDDGYDESEQFALINEGSITANGLLDNISATGLLIENTTLATGLSNSGNIAATTYRDGVVDGDTGGDIAHAYAVHIGSGTIAGIFDNSGIIAASATESQDVFTDSDNILDPNGVFATAIALDAGSNITELYNTGSISAALSGREGEAYAIDDNSGNLVDITNEGLISVLGATSDTDATDDDAAPEFTLVAIDASSSTSAVTLTQQQRVDDDPDDGLEPITPFIVGDILFGSYADTFTSTAGSILGDVDFGAGNDIFSLTNTAYLGNISNSAGTDLDITLSDNSSLTPADVGTVNVRNLTVDSTSTLGVILDGDAALTNPNYFIDASGNITLQDGAALTPILTNIIEDNDYTFGDPALVTTYEVLNADGALTINGGIDSLQPETTPVLYDVAYSQDGDILTASLSLRDPSLLGLDTAHLGNENEVYGAVVGALRDDDDLGSAFAGITDQTEFLNAYNQILPEFSAAATQFVGSNIDGATGSVATHLNNARLSDQQPGSAWIQEFGYYADRKLSGLSEAFRGYGFGFTGGLDTAIGPFHTAGVNFGFAATEVEDVLGIDDPLTVQTLQAGLYAGYAMGALSLDGYIGGGLNSFESNRNIEVGDYSQSVFGDWDGTHYNAALNVGYDVNIGEKYFLRPSLNVSFMSMTEEAYQERGSEAFNLAIAERTSELGHASALLNFGGYWEDDKKWWRPSMRIGARSDFTDGGTATVAAFLSSGTDLNYFTLNSGEFPNEAFIFGLSFAMGTKYSSFGFDYDADLRDGYSLHTARFVLRMLF